MSLAKLKITSEKDAIRTAKVLLDGIELTDHGLMNVKVELGVDQSPARLTAEFQLGSVEMDAEVAMNLVAHLVDAEYLTIVDPEEYADEPESGVGGAE